MKPGAYKIYCAVTTTIEFGARPDKVKTVLSEAADVTIKGHEIYTAAEFKELADNTSAMDGYRNHYINLKADIDLAEVCGPDKGNWVPFGWF